MFIIIISDAFSLLLHCHYKINTRFTEYMLILYVIHHKIVLPNYLYNYTRNVLCIL